MGAVAWNYPKCGSSRFKRSKVWELPLYTSTSVGAPVLSVRKCGSFHLECPKCGSTRVKHSKVGELSFETTRSVGALALMLKSMEALALNIHKLKNMEALASNAMKKRIKGDWSP